MASRALMVLFLASSLALAACGDEAPGKEGETQLVPMRVGAVWTYEVAEARDGRVWQKTQHVDASGAVSGVSGEVLTVITEQSDGDRTVSFQRWVTNGLIRYREESYKPAGLHRVETYTPSRLRVPVLTSVGTSVSETFREADYDGAGRLIKDTDKTEVWTLEGIDPIVVPAGVFERALRFRRVGANNSKRFWYVEGVGKVKEESAEQTEQLTGYQVP